MADAITSYSDIWVPQTSIPAVAEASRKGRGLLASRAIARSAEFDSLAANTGGNTVIVPTWNPLVADDQVQEENTGPEKKKTSMGTQVAPILERVNPYAVTAQARQAAIASGDPLAYIRDQLVPLRQKNQQKAMVKYLRGVFGNAAFAPLVKKIAVEVAADVDADKLITGEAALQAAALMGELKEDLVGGDIWMHSVIESALTIQDQIEFVKNSEGQIVTKMFKGLTVRISDSLVRAGTGAGAPAVYETYIFAPGRVAFGQAPQSSRVGDVSSITLKEDADTNSVVIYDRYRYIAHLNGVKWVRAAAAKTATDAELLDSANYALGWTDLQNIGAVLLLTNG